MLYIIGLTLAFIFGFLMGRGWIVIKRGNSDPFDIKLTDADIDPGYKTETVKHEVDAENIDWENAAIYYPQRGGRMWN